MHLVVDISSHGYGHLAQTAPVLNLLGEALPALRITVRSALPAGVIAARLRCRHTHQPRAMDFGMLMKDATRVDLPATVRAYRDFHDGWRQRVEREARTLDRLRADLLLANVPYLSLAAAQAAGVPALAMCSLNWLDLYRELCAPVHGSAARIAHEMQAAYAAARMFLALQPAMPMPGLGAVVAIGPVAETGRPRRQELARRLGVAMDRHLVLMSMGGFQYPLDPHVWPAAENLFFLVPGPLAAGRSDMADLAAADMPFPDLQASVDAVLTKPGYGSFVEAACAGVAVAYVRRERWPEQEALLSWLHEHARCIEVAEPALQRGSFFHDLRACLEATRPARVVPCGVAEAASVIRGLL